VVPVFADDASRMLSDENIEGLKESQSRPKGAVRGAAFPAKASSADESPHHRLKGRGAQHTVASINRVAAVEVEKPRPGFLRDDLQRGQIPGLSRLLDPDVGATRGDHHRVQSAAQTSDGPEVPHPVHQVTAEGGLLNVGKGIQAKHGLRHFGDRRGSNPLAVHERAAAARCVVGFRQRREMGDPKRHLAAIFERQQGTPESIPADKIACAVDGIDDPPSPRGRSLFGAFFPENSVIWKLRAQILYQKALAFAICRRDRRVVRLGIRLETCAPVAQGSFSCATHGFQRRLQFSLVSHQDLLYRWGFGGLAAHATVLLMESRTVFSMLEEAACSFGSAAALHEPTGSKDGDPWRPYSWVEYRQAVEEIAAGLDCLGVTPGDLVALDSETRIEFYFADLGVMTAGAIAAALYTSYPPAEQVRTLRLLEPKAVFVENPKLLGALLSMAEPPIQTRWILLTGEAEDAMTLTALRQLGKRALSGDPGLLARLKSRIKPEDPAILYLTSGATGEPKMGLVTHRALVANCDIGIGATPIGPDHVSIAFLPSAHITQRVAMEMFPIRTGMPVYFSEGLSRLPHELKSIRPTFFVAPPRVWERMYSSICAEIKKKGAVTQRVFYWALGIGSEVARRRQEGREVPGWMQRALRLADRLVFQKIRERLGGRLQMAISGAAPLGKDLADFYAAIGMPIYEGYGLTEGGIVALNPFGRPKSGSIGKPLPGIEMKLAADGELIFRGPTVFSGYYKSPDGTASILRDGWLHTGDVAEFDAEGYVYITGRKKEVLVSSNGKKIYPSLIEGLFKMEPLINQVLLLGDKQPYVAALFTLNLPNADGLKGMEDWKGRPVAEVVRSPVLRDEVKRIVQKVNKQLAPFEQIRRYQVLDRDFSIEAGELTPTMKVRRARVIENHRKVVAELFLGREE